MIIAFAGRAGSGKSTSCNYMSDGFEATANGARIINFADPLKHAAGMAWGFSHAQLHGHLKEEIDPRYGVTPRKVMQHLGTEHGRHLCEDLWLQRMSQTIKMVPPFKHILIGDLRFPNEFDMLEELGATLVWLDRGSKRLPDGVAKPLVRQMMDAMGGGFVKEHVSETALLQHVNNERFDFVLQNHGSLEQLYGMLNDVVESAQAPQ